MIDALERRESEEIAANYMMWAQVRCTDTVANFLTQNQRCLEFRISSMQPNILIFHFS